VGTLYYSEEDIKKYQDGLAKNRQEARRKVEAAFNEAEQKYEDDKELVTDIKTARRNISILLPDGTVNGGKMELRPIFEASNFFKQKSNKEEDYEKKAFYERLSNELQELYDISRFSTFVTNTTRHEYLPNKWFFNGKATHEDVVEQIREEIMVWREESNLWQENSQNQDLNNDEKRMALRKSAFYNELATALENLLNNQLEGNIAKAVQRAINDVYARYPDCAFNGGRRSPKKRNRKSNRKRSLNKTSRLRKFKKGTIKRKRMGTSKKLKSNKTRS
jgi:hypothetical protein